MKKTLVKLVLLMVMLAGICAGPAQGTLVNTTSNVTYSATGSQTVFTYPFKIFAAADLQVFVKDTVTGLTAQKILNVDYTVAGVGLTNGGTVIFYVAPSGTQQVSISRGMPFLQSQAYVQGGPFPAKSHEDSLDKIVMEIQGLNSRAIKAPSGMFDLALPTPAPSPAGLYLRWNANGTVLGGRFPWRRLTRPAAP